MRRVWLLVVALLILSVLPVQAETAAVLEIMYPGVEVRRAETDAWIEVRVGAIMPFGMGDSLRTGAYGRALLAFSSDLETLILPRSEYLITELDTDRLAQRVVSGVAVTAIESRRVDVATQSGDLAVTAAAGHFAVQTSTDGVGRVIVAAGEAAAQSGGDTVTITAASGLRDGSPLSALTMPASFAHLDAALDGCPGVVRARGEDNLNVRAGNGLDFDEFGVVANGTTIDLMAVTPHDERYRIRFKNEFGWVLASGVQTDCRNLPVLPYSTVETTIGVIDPTAHELELLTPFYGPPDDDTWFFRFTASAPG